MKFQVNLKSIRILLVSVLMVAAMTCTALFFTASASGNVSPSDTGGSCVARGGADSLPSLYKPDAVYNGNYRDELTNTEKKIYDALVQHVLVEESMDLLSIDVSDIHCLKSDKSYLNNLV